MIYREEGWVAEVEVISRASTPAIEGRGEGEETTLKVLGIIRESSYIKPEALPKVGEIFTVWKANDAPGYGGWHLDVF